MISIIIPAYNAAKFLRRTIESVRNQSYLDKEIIVVDDCSKDETKLIMQEYEKEGLIKAVYLNENKGVSNARNVGIDIAKGEYIMFIDADDLLLKNALEKYMEASIKYDSDYVDSNRIFATKKKKYTFFTEKKLPNKELHFKSYLEDQNMLLLTTYITGKLIKKELIANIRFDTNLSRYEDMVFEHQLKLKAKNYVLLKDLYYVYFQNIDSLDNTFGLKHTCYLESFKQINNLYKNKYCYDYVMALMIQNMVFLSIAKISKNNLSLKENSKIIFDYLNNIKSIVPNYLDNKYLDKGIKRFIKNLNVFHLKIIIFITKPINIIKLYFKYNRLFNKYLQNVDINWYKKRK